MNTQWDASTSLLAQYVRGRQMTRDVLGASRWPPAHLCQVCRVIFSGTRRDSDPGVPKTSPLGQTLEELERSATSGCRFCYMRCQQLTDSEKSSLSQSAPIMFGYIDYLGPQLVFTYQSDSVPIDYLEKSVRLQPLEKEDEITLVHALSRRFIDCGIEPSGRPDAELFTCSTYSISVLVVVQKWLKACRHEHVACQALRATPNFLPTRLIDLGPSSAVAPVILPGATLPPHTQYFTLSHCWGSQVPLRLLTHNLSSFQQSMPVASLSRTFRDAMEVTKLLGCRYIWIDSLCIIQDSEDDWRHESAQMGQVYAHSALNIAAARGIDGSSGLFTNRFLMDVEPCLVETAWDGQSHARYLLGNIDITNEMEDCHLFTRGWVTQERLLAPSILHFCNKQIFWQCEELTASETWPRGMPWRGKNANKVTLNSPPGIPGLLEFEGLSRQFAKWKQVLDLYSATDLTFPVKDKLLAISGVARSLDLLNLGYVAGMCRTNLPQHLTWQVSNKGNSGQKPRRYRPPERYVAPTWSWASINGRLILAPAASESDDDHVTVLSISVTLATEDQYGPVEDGSVKLLARLAAGRLSIQDQIDCTRVVFRNGAIVEEPLPDNIPPQIRRLMFIGEAQCDLCFDEIANDQLRDGMAVSCLPTQKWKDGGYCGLIIQHTGKKGEYFRIGVFRIHVAREPGNGARYEALCRDFDESYLQRTELYEDARRTEDGSLRYLVTLV